MKKQSRRKFIKLSAFTAAFLGLSAGDVFPRDFIEERLDEILDTPSTKYNSVIGLKVDPIEKVRVGLLGLGNRGLGHLRQLKALHPKAEITALCDIRPGQVDKAKELLSSKKVKSFSGAADAWRKMVESDKVDLIIISTPWLDHVPMAVHAMENGKHVALEVPAAITLEGCWKLVDTAEKYQVNCMMMENVCYGDEELWLLNMVHHNVFGTITYAEGAYIHDLRDHMFSKSYYYNQWRIRHHLVKDGNLYPTHGLGPIAQYLDIYRGDSFDKLVSMSSLSAGFIEESKLVEADNEFYNLNSVAHGDMNNSIIKTKKGRTILVQHDVTTPRPYSRINALAGTKAYHEGYPSRMSRNDVGNGHRWLNEEEYMEMRTKYKHPIWDELKEEIEKNGGHGGMDFVQMYRLIDCLNKGIPLDMDVYDGAAWSVVVPISKLSVELGSVPIDFPDFTRGRWKEERQLGIMKIQ